MRGRSYPKSEAMTVSAARTQLALLLAGCTDERLAVMTPESLATSHRVPLKDCEYALTIERQRRRR